MDEYIHAAVQWVQGSVKASPYAWCAFGLTFLLGVQVLLAVAIIHGDEATVRRQLISLERIDVHSDDATLKKSSILEGAKVKKSEDNQQQNFVTVNPVAPCADVKVSLIDHPDAQTTFHDCYTFAAESGETDDQGFAVWKSLDQQSIPALSRIKVELWLPKKPHADKRDPLVLSGGCIVMSFADPALEGWLEGIAGMIGRSLRTPQVACILPLQVSLEDIEQHKLSLRPFEIDGEDVKGLDMEKLPAFSDILPKLRLFLGYSERQGITIFKRS
ncbi:molybdopterin cofactor [Fusarium beomiforme]|uniref:Molybdopterin cofactor n=1 Tax=Fusarium beomiforme TaxID=44412 RepID=A0A9P5ABA4_9HYPO|nr:molybdopterin cofactor [Fusarium beomiforme]